MNYSFTAIEDNANEKLLIKVHSHSFELLLILGSLKIFQWDLKEKNILKNVHGI